MDQMEVFRRTFFEECADLLALADAQLVRLADAPDDGDALAALFRAVHSIKGGGGAFGFERLVAFTHLFETTLDVVRGKPELAADLLDRAAHKLLMRSFDMLSDLVSAAREGYELPPAHEAEAAAALAGWLEGFDDLDATLSDRLPAARASAPEPSPLGADEAPAHSTVRFTPHSDLLRRANEPLLLIRELKSFAHVQTQVDMLRLPPLDLLDHEICYLAWTFDVTTTAGADRIAEVFEFVMDDCDLEIVELTTADDRVPSASEEAPASVDVPISARTATPADAESPRASTALTGSIRVDLEKVDRLVNMVGEIVITQAMLSQQVEELQLTHHPGLIKAIEQMAHHIRELQESVMSIRAQPVRLVFSRMPRLVRELAGDLGKEARVTMIGEATEVDKTIIEQLSDPLTHMVRNAVDHGLELPETRVARGKPREGTITLSAAHRAGRIVIEIAEDGNGIDREKVRRKCIERGLVAADAALTDEEIDNFIFLPGFSTAERISSISGRGVGMDVVRQNIQALGGRVEVTSTPGVGSRFSLSLPLTLAVLDGMVVSVGTERYIVPLTAVIETLRPQAANISRLVNSGTVLAARGEYVRLVCLSTLFGIPGAAADASQGLVVLVEIEGGGKIGIVVDEILGQQQVVIKTLEANYKRIRGVSAATILGDGRVALILDVGGLSSPAESLRLAS